MIAANTSFSADSLDPNAPADWYHCKYPDINDKTFQEITKARSHDMFSQLVRSFRQQQRKGRNAAVRAAAVDCWQISLGTRALAELAGLDPKSARTQLRRLAGLGVIAISQDDRPFKTDPVTGRILENRVGRAKPVIITLTLKNRHMRPQSAGKKAKQLVGSVDSTKSLIGVRFPPPDFTDRGQISPTSKESPKELNKERPSGLTDGIGRPMAKDENTPPPALPMGSRPKGPRITPAAPLPAGRAAGYAKPSGRQNAYSEDHTPAAAWQGVDGDRFAATKARLERERTNHSPPVAREWLQPREACRT